MFFPVVRGLVITALAASAFGVPGVAQQKEVHGRKWKPMPDEAHIVVTVVKGFNGKPIENAGVIFHATRDGKNDGNLEVKSDPDGRAVIDVIDVGSHVQVQVIASGFATASQEIDVDGPNKELVFKMQRPRAQVSEYKDTDGLASQTKPGVQEHTGPTVPSKTPPPPPDVPRPGFCGPKQ